MGMCCSQHSPETSRQLVYHHTYKNRECNSVDIPVMTNGFGVGGSVGADPRYIPDFNRMSGTNIRKHGVDIIRTPTATFSHTISKSRIVVAVYNYQSREATDVSFIKGDRMEVIDDSEKDWWRVRHLRTNEEGLIPWNFVAEETSVESEE